MKINFTDIIEQAIIGQLVSALIEDHYRIEISDQDGGGLFVYAAKDGGAKPKSGYDYWVRLTPGNGAEVIVDYSNSLETLIAPINAFAEMFMD